MVYNLLHIYKRRTPYVGTWVAIDNRILLSIIYVCGVYATRVLTHSATGAQYRLPIDVIVLTPGISF